jgi:hypothetical protein
VARGRFITITLVQTMPQIAWGLLAPEKIDSGRRVRSLGLGTAVRAFNDRAVPGLGGVWYGKQVLNPLLGIRLAEAARHAGRRDFRNIVVANAVEALGCWLALKVNKWEADARVRGKNKMQGQTDIRFGNVSRPNFYVTQPFRPAAIQALLSLELVEGPSERFNSFTISEQIGKQFLDIAYSGIRPKQKSVIDYLLAWVVGEHDEKMEGRDSLIKAISPCEPMATEACGFLRNQLKQAHDDYQRRRGDALDWVSSLSPQDVVDWSNRPARIGDAHWRDLSTGAAFFQARTAAIDVLEELEQLLENREGKSLDLDAPVPEPIAQRIHILRRSSKAFLAKDHDPSEGSVASKFCLENVSASDCDVVRSLCQRDGRVLRIDGNRVLPGIAFRGTKLKSHRLLSEVKSNCPKEFRTGSEIFGCCSWTLKAD